MITVPPSLKKGDLIGIVCPAGYMAAEKVQACINTLREWGYQVKVGNTVGGNSTTYFSGTDEERMADFQQMLDDDEVKAVLCGRGGYGMGRIIDGIDFKKFSKTKLLYNQGFNVIDATIVPDGKRFIMFLKDETRVPPQKNIKIAYSKKLNEGYSNASASITGNYWAEGPTTLKINGKWVVYFDKYRDHKYGAVQSQDLINWTDISDNISVPKGIRHGSIFKVTINELDGLLKL